MGKTDFFDWFDCHEACMSEALQTVTNIAKTNAEMMRNAPALEWKSESDALVLRKFSYDSGQEPVLILPPQAGHSSHIAGFSMFSK